MFAVVGGRSGMYSVLLRRDMGRPPSLQDIIEGGKIHNTEEKLFSVLWVNFFPSPSSFQIYFQQKTHVTGAYMVDTLTAF